MATNNGKTILSSSLTIIIIGAILLSYTENVSGMHLGCLANCNQCVRVYADFFDGRQCAEYCLGMDRSFWGETPIDCNDPTTIAKFIRYEK